MLPFFFWGGATMAGVLSTGVGASKRRSKRKVADKMKRVGGGGERVACDSLRKRHPLWGSGLFPAGGGEAGGPVRDGWRKEVRVRREGVADEEPVAALEVVRAFRRKPFGAWPRSGHAHAGREAQGRLQFSERDAAGIVELVPAQESAYRVERVFGSRWPPHSRGPRARAESAVRGKSRSWDTLSR